MPPGMASLPRPPATAAMTPAGAGQNWTREDGKNANSGSGKGVHVDKMEFGRREALL